MKRRCMYLTYKDGREETVFSDNNAFELDLAVLKHHQVVSVTFSLNGIEVGSIRLSADEVL